uniref:Immunoglobulin-like protein A n=1 Tax=Leptospira interrogans serovar Icterohaemorrhagiae TaxID=90062 RepID=C8CS17_LEPIR|nr:immunoglobulin-like protein A [Leptospira interrogans serovar Icterohaemorrhagiae]
MHCKVIRHTYQVLLLCMSLQRFFVTSRYSELCRYGERLYKTIFSDRHLLGSITKDLTEDVTWFSSNPSSVVIENTPGKKGLAFASELGEPDITVFYDHHTQSSYTPVTVTESGIVNITISLSSISKTKGSTHQFKATGKFENGAEIDLTELVTWSSSNPTVVSISNVDDERGLATALSVGSSKISVDYNSISSSIDLEVTPGKISFYYNGAIISD